MEYWVGGMKQGVEVELVVEGWEDRHADDTVDELVVHRLVVKLRKLVLLFSSLTEDFDSPPLTYKNL